MKEKLRQDSRGYTLVELMLTIAILAVITIPILSYFTEAAKHNARSRTKQNATVAAQDVLEEFKNSPYSLDNCNVVCTPGSVWSIKTSPDSNGKYTVTRTMTVDRNTFTVDADITPVKGVVSGSGIISKKYERSIIGTMDTDKDVLASENGQSVVAAQLYFEGKYTEECASQTPIKNTDPGVIAGILSNLDCTIEIKADAKGPGKNDDIVVTVDYVYKYKSGTTTDGIDLSTVEYRENVEAASVIAKNLNNIYIFYNPLNLGETIKFKSNTNFASAVENDQLKLFLIAQSSVPAGVSLPSAGYTNRAPGYHITLLSSAPGCEPNDFNYKIAKVYTNLSIDNTEVVNNSDSLFNKLQKRRNKARNDEYTIVDQEDINRVAKIDVRVLKGTEEYVTVTGSKVQN